MEGRKEQRYTYVVYQYEMMPLSSKRKINGSEKGRSTSARMNGRSHEWIAGLDIIG
jgi:hypothetical protein